MASFPVPGIGGSGIDFETMIAQLQKAESQKLNPYLQKQQKYTGQVSTWGKISGSLDTIKTNLEKLQDEGFNGVSVGTNTTFKATAQKGAVPNSYSMVIKQLAKSHKVGSSYQDNREDDLAKATSTMTIKTGDGKEMKVELPADESSLDDIAKKINGKNGNVSASVVAVGNNQHQLVLSSKKTGDDGKITVDVQGDATLKSALEYEPGNKTPPDNNKAGQVTAPDNAIFWLDGQKIERSGNTISDAIPGITLELREVSAKDPDFTTGDKDNPDFYKAETLSVTADTSKVKGLIESFVSAYNSYLSAAASATNYVEPVETSGEELSQPSDANGALLGDGILRRLTSQMKSVIGKDYSEASDMFQTLGRLGIEVSFEDSKDGGAVTGKLKIDSKKLDAALKDHPEEAEALFLGTEGKGGIKAGMDALFKDYLGDKEGTVKTDGAIADSIKGLKEQESRVAKQIASMEKRIEQSLDRSRNEFDRLDQAIGQMNNLSSSLQSALAGIM